MKSDEDRNKPVTNQVASEKNYWSGLKALNAKSYNIVHTTITAQVC